MAGLTDEKIRGLRARGERAEHLDDIVRGLRIRGGITGTKTFILRARFGGKLRNYTLGRYHPKRFTLAQARALARRMLDDIEEGRDPAANLDAASRQTGRLKDLVELYLEREVRGRKRSAAEIERTFKVNIIPVLGRRYVESITKADVTMLVEKVAYRTRDERKAGRRDTPRQGRMVHQLLSAFFNWALPRLDGMQVNPCASAWHPRANRPRDRVLDEAEIRSLWHVSKEAGLFGKALQLLLLTGQRRGEVVGAAWREFNIERKLWTIPAVRAKNGKVNEVHLSRASIEVLRTILATSDMPILFPAKGNPQVPISEFSKLWARVLADMGEDLRRPLEHFTIHDIRRTVATGMQRLGVRLEVIEAVLNHVSGSRAGIVGIYQRHHFTSERREALDLWASELRSISRRECGSEDFEVATPDRSFVSSITGHIEGPQLWNWTLRSSAIRHLTPELKQPGIMARDRQ